MILLLTLCSLLNHDQRLYFFLSIARLTVGVQASNTSDFFLILAFTCAAAELFHWVVPAHFHLLSE